MTMYPLKTRTFLTTEVEKGCEGSLLVSVTAHNLIHRCEGKSDGRLLGNIFILKDSVVDREMCHLDLSIKKGPDACCSRECGHQPAISCQFLQEPPSQGSPYQRGNKGWGVSIQHETTMTGNAAELPLVRSAPKLYFFLCSVLLPIPSYSRCYNQLVSQIPFQQMLPRNPTYNRLKRDHPSPSGLCYGWILQLEVLSPSCYKLNTNTTPRMTN